MASVGSAFIDFKGDFSSVVTGARRAGGQAAETFGGQFKRDINGNLGNSRQFTNEGKKAGGLFTRGVSDGSKSGWKLFGRSGDKAGQDAGKGAGSGFLGSFKGVLAAAVAIGGVELFKGFVDSASNMQETLSKSNTVFGSSAKGIENWSKTAASSFGQSQQQALDAAGTFGNLFVQLGIGSGEAAKLSKSQVELASDFASFHNTSPEEAIEAMTAAYRGEYDAVQKYVPTITAAAVEQQGLKMGLAGTTDELTAQDKALATQTLLTKGAGDAMGDFDRTAGGTANTQRRLSAVWADAQARLGQGLLPIVTTVASFLADNLPRAIDFAGKAFNWLRDRIAPVVNWFRDLFQVFKLDGLSGAWEMISAKLGELLSSLGNWITGTALPWLQMKLAEWGSALWGWIQPQIMPMLSKLWELLGALGNWITGTALPSLWAKLGEWGAALWGWIQPQILPMIGKLGELLAAIRTWATDVAFPALVAKLAEWGKALWSWVEPQIGPTLVKLGLLVAGLTAWIIAVGLPWITEKLLKWAFAFGDWVLTSALPWLMTKIAELLTWLGEWVVFTALPWIHGKLLEWSRAFSDWITETALPWLGAKVAELLTWLGNWIVFTALPWIHGKLLEWARAFGDWITETAIPWLTQKTGEMLTWLGGWMTQTALPAIIEQLKKWGKAFGDFITDTAIPWLMEKVGDLLSSLTTWFTDTALPGIKKKLGEFASSIGGGIAGIIGSAFDSIPGAISGVLRLAGNLIAGFLRGAAGIADKVGLGPIASALRSGADSADKWGEGGGGNKYSQGVREPGAYARGGSLPPFMTNGARAIVGEGNPRFPEYVIPTDPQYRGRARGLWEQAGTQLLAGGGMMGRLHYEGSNPGWWDSTGRRQAESAVSLLPGAVHRYFDSKNLRAYIGDAHFSRMAWAKRNLTGEEGDAGRLGGAYNSSTNEIGVGGNIAGGIRQGLLHEFGHAAAEIAKPAKTSGGDAGAYRAQFAPMMDWIKANTAPYYHNIREGMAEGFAYWVQKKLPLNADTWYDNKYGFDAGIDRGPAGFGTGGGGVNLGFSPQDALLKGLREVAGGALERIWPTLPVPNNMLGMIPGGHNYMRKAIIDKIKGESASREKFLAATVAHVPVQSGAQSGGGFTKSGGGGPAGNYTPAMMKAKADILGKFGQMSVGGYANRNVQGTGKLSDHARWRAWDFMVGSNRGKGNSIASHLQSNSGQYGVKYLIWYDQINDGGGWRPYSHPGNPGGKNPTLAHRDHVHASFLKEGGVVPVSVHGRSFDSGGVLAPGWNAVRNDTGAPEPVAPVTQRGPLVGTVVTRSPEDIDMLVRRMAFSLGGVG